jgi:uncharacterized protein (TIGR03437 family)
MKRLRCSRIFSVLFALTVCTGYVHAQTTLTASPTTINLSCTMGQACIANSGSIVYSASSTLTATASSSPSAPFTVAAPSVPWLTLTVPSSPDTGTATLTFSVTAAWTSLNAGLNTTTVQLTSADATNGTGITFTVNLMVQEATPTLTVKGGLNTLNPAVYLTGSAAPVLSLTLLSSSGLPVPFTVSTSSTETAEGVQNWLTAVTTSGIAYSWGTTVSFTTGTAATLAAPGETLTGQITVTPSGASAIVMPVNINVSAGAPTIVANGVTPSLVPLLANGVTPGFVSFVIKGSGFVSSPATQKTKVFYGATAATCNNPVLTDYVTILNSTYIQVQVPFASTGAPFATAGAAAFVIGVANGQSPAIATATASVGVTAAPIVSGITSASTFVEAAPGTNPKVAPYDIISIFGTNLCPLCSGTSNVLVGAPDPVYFRFPTFLSPDGTHKITVTFSKPGASTTNLPGYLLFATNNQINVAVPGALSTLEGTTAPNVGVVNVQVGYDTVTPAVNISAAFPVAYAAVDPGIFTIESSGEGQAAILDNSTYLLNSSTHPADTSAGTSTFQIYLTGLGIPDSAATNATNAAAGGTWFGGTFNCIAPIGGVVGSASNVTAGPGSYMQTVNTPATWNPIATVSALEPSYVVPSPLWTSVDGAVMSTSFLNTNVAVPCFLGTDASSSANYITVTIGTSSPTVLNAQTATGGAGIAYAGFAPNAIAGLYQIDVTLAQSTGTGTAAQYPISISINGTAAVSTQNGVTMWIK